MKTSHPADNNNDKSDAVTHITDCGLQPVSTQGQVEFLVNGDGPVLALSEVLPVLENMNMRVLSAATVTNTGQDTEQWQICFQLCTTSPVLSASEQVQLNFQQLFMAVMAGEVENDGFNALITATECSIDEIVMLRAIARYLLQIKIPYSQQYMEQALCAHPQLATQLVALFAARFNPETITADERTQRQDDVEQEILKALELVETRDEDQILRAYMAVMKATLRTSFYQGSTKTQALSFKLRPSLIEGIPQPVPEFEIFVYSPRIEGVHLRGGKVARGGLRWSDRKEDFRTEVLGLAKAQMVKNAVIVPVGAKGGFVIKQTVAAGEKAPVEACYSEFIRALLNITDNLKQDQVIAPLNVVRHDDDDPYLVVAADKGTATLSDVANAIAAEYDFWLGDAFASGGANGYDHKKMGITARGAWESTKRLFKEMGIDSQAEDFTAVAIGDMSGDVFGNGMLLSEHIALVAAFNHRHIFIDPNPNVAASYAERQRLFALPYSGWNDYNAELISAGGGVFSRSAKSIKLTAEMRQLLDIPAQVKQLSPDQLIQHLLKAQVDLIWNGGIGTYIKASDESDQDVGDRANDLLRVDANQVRACAIVEGGNLGLTQRARIEFAAQGGLVNTDAIDNSGGVDCSDHEVNIKILLQQLLAEGVIDEAERVELLEQMTDEVAELVLRNNYQQSKMLSQSNHTCQRFIDKHGQLIQLLEKEGLLKRKLEDLPNDATIEERIKAHQGLTRPEIAVLLAYSKTHLFGKLIETDLIEDSLIQQELLNYFPSQLRGRFAEAIFKHPLRKEILAAQITNQVANRMGATFCNYLLEERNTDTARLIKAFAAVRAGFGITDIAIAIEALGLQVPNSTQMELHLKLHYPVERAVHWLLNHADAEFDALQIIGRYQEAIGYIQENLQALLNEQEWQLYQQTVKAMTDEAVPEAIAESIAALTYTYHALDITEIALSSDRSIADVVEHYFRINNQLDLFWLRRTLDGVPVYDKWHRKALLRLGVKMNLSARHLVCKDINSFAAECSSNQWQPLVDLITEVKGQSTYSLAMMTVVADRMAELV